MSYNNPYNNTNDDYFAKYQKLSILEKDVSDLGIDAYIHMGYDQCGDIAVIRFKNENDMNLYKISGRFADCWDVTLIIGCNDF